METIWLDMLIRLAQHVQVILPVLIAVGVVGLGPIGRALARRIAGGDAKRAELESLRQQVVELQERADYSERLLGTLRSQLPAAAGGQPRAPDSRPVTPV